MGFHLPPEAHTQARPPGPGPHRYRVPSWSYRWECAWPGTCGAVGHWRRSEVLTMRYARDHEAKDGHVTRVMYHNGSGHITRLYLPFGVDG
jgi:hypothetical protein